MKTKYITTIALIAIFIFINGFMSNDRYFPAPLNETNAAFYLNFARTGIYKDKSGENKTKLLEDVHYICQTFGIPENSADSFVSDKLLNDYFKLREIYAYYSDPMSFTIILTGKFDTDKFIELIGTERINNKYNGFSTVLNYEIPGNQRLYIEISPNMIVLCPENITGNIFDNLDNEINCVKKTLPDFANSVASQEIYTALGATINEKNMKKILPEWLAQLKHINIKIDSSAADMQMVFPSTKELSKATENVKTSLSSFESSIKQNERFTLNTKENNIYINAVDADIELGRTLLNRTAAFIMQFFIKS